MDPLLFSKIVIPQASSMMINRPRITNYIAPHAQLITIQAPAGYGKTTVIIQWIKEQTSPVAWISLEKFDNDLNRFIECLFTSIDFTFHTVLHQNLTVSSTQHLLRSDYLLNQCLEAISRLHTPFSIVLDDYYLIENPLIHQFIEQFIENLPANAKVFITSRSKLPLPIAKWRTKFSITHLTMDHLRFTEEETHAFLNPNANQLTYLFDYDELHQRTEGWVTGLLLFKLTSSLDLLSEDLQHENFINDYLWTEIIRNLRPSIQHFLLVTSLLNELDPFICNEITQRTDSAEILNYLETSGLFTIKINPLKPVYRYHHLFADALQKELYEQYSEEAILEIIEEIVHVLYDKYDKVFAIDLCIQHHLFELALNWMDENISVLCELNYINLYLSWLKTLKENVHFMPYNLLLIGYSHAITASDFELANSIMEELDGRQQLFGWMNDAQYKTIAEIYDRTRSYAIIATRGNLFDALEIMGKYKEENTLDANYKNLLIVYNPFEYHLLRTNLAGKGYLPTLQNSAVVTQLFQAKGYIKFRVSAFILGISAEVAYERYQSEDALDFLFRTLEYCKRQPDLSLSVPMHILHAKILAETNDVTYVTTYLQSIYKHINDSYWLNFMRLAEANYFIKANNLQAAAQIIQQTKSNSSYWLFTYQRLLLAQHNYEEALKIAFTLKMNAIREDQIATIVESSIAEALAYYYLGKEDLVLERIHEAIYHGASNYYYRTILEHDQLHPFILRYLADPLFKAKRKRSPERFPKEYFDSLHQFLS